MICTGVLPCLSSGLAKNNNLCPCLSYFPGFLVILKVWLFSTMEDKPNTKAVKQDIFSLLVYWFVTLNPTEKHGKKTLQRLTHP